MPDASDSLPGFSTFLQLERTARHAATREELAYVAANDTRRLVAYRQAALIEEPGGPARVSAVSGVAVLDRDAPFIQWLQRTVRALALTKPDTACQEGSAAGTAAVRRIEPDALPPDLARDWPEWGAPHVLWVPLPGPDGNVGAVLWLSRDVPWRDADLIVLERLADCYGHAQAALSGRRRPRGGVRRWGAWAIAAALVAALFVPVRQSALAPAEVVPRDPTVVAAPLDGVIADVFVEPNQSTMVGDRLFAFDDTVLRNRHAVAQRALAVARAEHRQASQAAFDNPRDTAQLAALQARVDMRAAELAYAAERLARVEVTASSDGVTVFTDRNDWIGRPVQTGERIMLLADPSDAELRVFLPVADAITLDVGAPVHLFLDVSPLAPLDAALRRASYEAEVTPAGVLAYRVAAGFPEGETTPRVGLQGTAKIYGETVPLGLYLFRRPIALVRRTLGL